MADNTATATSTPSAQTPGPAKREDITPTETREALASEKASAAEAKKAVREKHVKALSASLGLAAGDEPPPPVSDEDGEKPAGKPKDKADRKPKPDEKAKSKDKAEQAKADEKVKKTPPKADEKTAEKPKPEEDDPEKEAPKDDAELRRDKRQFSAFREREIRRLKAQESTLAQREAQVKQIEERAKAEIEAFKADKIGWLKRNGVDFKQSLLDLAKEDSEDPKDRLLREAREKAEAVDRRLAEREAREAEEKAAREKEAEANRTREAQSRIRTELGREWDAVREGDEFPYLSTLYEPSDVAQLALDTLLHYYKRTGQELTPGQVFARLENALRAEDTARQKARSKAKGEAAEEDTSRSPDRVRSVKSESPEADNRPTHDVSNRTARVASNAETSPANPPGYDRAALINKARAAMRH